MGKTAGIVLLLSLLVACGGTPTPVELEAEEYAVYAAVIRAMYLPGPSQIVIENRTTTLDLDLGRISEICPASPRRRSTVSASGTPNR